MACKATTSSSSSKKSCTYNDEPVDCSTLNPVKAEAFTLKANVKSAITISENKIEILENTESKEDIIKNGNLYECMAATHAGEIYSFGIDGKKLKIESKNGSEVYNRVSGSPKNIIGTWSFVESDSTGSMTVTRTFSEDKMELNVKCFYK